MAANDVDVENAGLTGALSGAAAGSAFGLPGAAVGAAIGLGIGVFGANRQNKANKKAEKKRKEALFKANLFKAQARKQKESLMSSSKNLKAATPKGNTIPTGSTPTSAIGQGFQQSSKSSSGTF